MNAFKNKKSRLRLVILRINNTFLKSMEYVDKEDLIIKSDIHSKIQIFQMQIGKEIIINMFSVQPILHWSFLS